MLLKLFEEWKKRFKNKSKKTPSEIENRKRFQDRLDSTMDIKAHNAESTIKCNKNMSCLQKQKILDFIHDQLFGSKQTYLLKQAIMSVSNASFEKYKVQKLGDEVEKDDNFGEYFKIEEIVQIKKFEEVVDVVNNEDEDTNGEIQAKICENKEVVSRVLEDIVDHMLSQLQDDNYIDSADMIEEEQEKNNCALVTEEVEPQVGLEVEDKIMTNKRKEIDIETDEDNGVSDIECYLPFNSKRKSRQDFVPALIPNDILKKTASTAAAQSISPASHVALIGHVLLESKVDLSKVTLSRTSASVAHKNFFSDGSKQTLNLLQNCKYLSLHLDGKKIKEYTEGRVRELEREAIVISSPELNKPLVLSIPGIASSSAENQFKCVEEALQGTNLAENIIKINSDTTNSMVGIRGGANVLIERRILNRTVLKTPCRRHISELIARNVADKVTGEASTGPEVPLYNKLKKEWNNLLDKGIDYSNLNKFDWNTESNVMKEAALSSLEFLENAHKTNVFPRDDYNELFSLTWVYLGGEVEFRFQTPGASHKARSVIY